MIELGMEVMNLNGYLGVVAASPRNGKWLVVDGNKSFRVREEEMREYDREIEDRIICWEDDCPAYAKWLEKRELL